MADKNQENWRLQKDENRRTFMTDDEITEIDNIITNLNTNRSNMQDIYDEWADIEEAYLNDQPEVKNMPNSRINRLHANIEGQVTALVEQNIAIVCRGQGPSDSGYAKWAQIGLDWTLRKNKIKTVLTVHERRKKLFGNGIFGLSFDPKAINNFGLVKINPTPLNKLFIDGKIKDPLRTQEAEYMTECISMSRGQFLDRYGEMKANSIDYGNNPYRDNGVFIEASTIEDDDSAVLLLHWTRQDGKLRLREFSADGVLLYDCHKEGDRDHNQKSSKEHIKSYYKYVYDQYPYFWTILYPVEGRLQGFGDGKLILPLQKLLNELYDKIRIAARPNMVFFDPDLIETDLSDFDENSLNPRPANLMGGGAPAVSIPWMQVQPDWWALLKQIEEEFQHVSRFSSLMLGMQGRKEQTATESAIQQQQGGNAIDHQKVLLQETLSDMCEYALGLMMEHYTSGKAFRIDENKEDYEWIDFRQMAKVPVMQSADSGYLKEYEANNPGKPLPQFTTVKDKDNKDMTKSAELDIEINIGAGLPKNKAFLYQMMAQLAPVSIAGMPLIEWTEMRALLKDWLGLPLGENEETLLKIQVEQYQQMQQQGQQGQMAAGQTQPTPPKGGVSVPTQRNPIVNNNNPSGDLHQQSGMIG